MVDRVPTGPCEPTPPTTAATEWEDLARNAAGFGVGQDAGRRSREIGAAGEIRIGELLGELVEPSRWGRLRGRTVDWRVLHSVPLRAANGAPRGDVEHMLIGPPGVVTINTKHHPGALVELDGDALSVDGRGHAYVREARVESLLVRSRLTTALAETGEGDLAGRLRVRPVVVLVGTRLLVHRWADGVLVLLPRELLHTVRQLPVGLDPTDRDTLFQLARRSTTWVHGPR